jgi:hypothetical protein
MTRLRTRCTQVGSGSSAYHPVNVIISFLDLVVITVAQLEPLPVLGDGLTELGDRGNAVHIQCRLISPPDGLVGLDKNHALAQAGDDLLKLTTVGLGSLR